MITELSFSVISKCVLTVESNKGAVTTIAHNKTGARNAEKYEKEIEKHFIMCLFVYGKNSQLSGNSPAKC